MLNYLKEQVNISLSDEMQKKFDFYCKFLREENEKYNLTAITDEHEIWVKHFVDSILGSVAIPQNSSVCDVGSGAGFPCLPLAIARPDLSVTLVDSLEKRINFTKELCRQIELKAEFFHARVEDFSLPHVEKYDVATARAVAPLNILLEYTAQIVKVGGIIVAYKTDLSELESSANACKVLGVQYETHYDFVLPDGSKRTILVFRKNSHTPAKYPRGQNKPRKQPL